MRRFTAELLVGATLFAGACSGDGDANKFPTESQILIDLGRQLGESYDESSKNIVSSVVDGEVQVVEVTDDVDHFGAEQIVESFELFDTFADEGSTRLVPFAEADKQGYVVGEGFFDVEIKPVDKDHIVFSIPTSMDPNAFYGSPSVFTDFIHFDRTVSVIRPDEQAAEEGLFVEACQSNVDVVLNFTPEESASLSQRDRDGYDLLVQETVCNGLGRALFAKLMGISYQQYAAIHEDKSAVPNIAYARENGISDVFVDMPILTEDAYNNITGLPSTSLVNLIYGDLVE